MMAAIRMRDDWTCPNCGSELRPEALPRSLTAGRLLTADLLLWVAIVLFLAFLWSPRAAGELYAVLGVLALVVWALLRSRQRVDRRDFEAHGRYRCDHCNSEFTGEDLRAMPPPRGD